MGRYIQWLDVVNRYPTLAKLAGAENVSSSWLGFAEYEVDARLAAKYTTPFSPAPEVVRDLAIDLTYYKAMVMQDGSEKLLQYIESRFESLIDGTIVISGAADATIPAHWDDVQHRTSFGLDNVLKWRPNDESIEKLDNTR